ncbi:MAG: hypothetical protein HY584_06590 [Candidatus Omnitrophica bacterium]|nr:hypothetical protein [Candidatus Omnitrophota bacterium]
MPSFTSQIPNLKQVGPVCQIKVGISGTAQEVFSQKGEPIPQLPEVTALIDTGAAGTCINPTIVDTLGLVSRGVTRIATPSTKAHPCNVYDVLLHFQMG